MENDILGGVQDGFAADATDFAADATGFMNGDVPAAAPAAGSDG